MSTAQWNKLKSALAPATLALSLMFIGCGGMEPLPNEIQPNSKADTEAPWAGNEEGAIGTDARARFYMKATGTLVGYQENAPAGNGLTYSSIQLEQTADGNYQVQGKRSVFLVGQNGFRVQVFDLEKKYGIKWNAAFAFWYRPAGGTEAWTRLEIAPNDGRCHINTDSDKLVDPDGILRRFSYVSVNDGRLTLNAEPDFASIKPRVTCLGIELPKSETGYDFKLFVVPWQLPEDFDQQPQDHELAYQLNEL